MLVVSVWLIGGPNMCEGLLVLRKNGGFGLACNLNTGDEEVRVVCRELEGCNPTNATRVNVTEGR